MTIDLKAAIRKWAIDTLPYDHSDADIAAEFKRKGATELLIIYHNWMSRHIFAMPRKVHISAAYEANPTTTQRKTDLDALIEKIEKGNDLTPHLSTRVNISLDSLSKKINRRKHLDLMLIEWEVHHLHISQKMRSDGFVERGNPLLFAVFHVFDAYLIDVMTHDDFNRDHILEIMVREFPDAGLIHELKVGPGEEMRGLVRRHNEDERTVLRNAGINTLVEIDGKVYKPAGGITAAGTSVRASMAADAVIRATERLDASLVNDRAQFQRLAQDHGLIWPSDPTFEFGLLKPRGLAFKELSTNLAFIIA